MIPQIPKTCDRILVTLMNIQPYYSQCDPIRLPITRAYPPPGGEGAKNNAATGYVGGCLTVHNPLFSVYKLWRINQYDVFICQDQSNSDAVERNAPLSLQKYLAKELV